MQQPPSLSELVTRPQPVPDEREDQLHAQLDEKWKTIWESNARRVHEVAKFGLQACEGSQFDLRASTAGRRLWSSAAALPDASYVLADVEVVDRGLREEDPPARRVSVSVHLTTVITDKPVQLDEFDDAVQRDAELARRSVSMESLGLGYVAAVQDPVADTGHIRDVPEVDATDLQFVNYSTLNDRSVSPQRAFRGGIKGLLHALGRSSGDTMKVTASSTATYGGAHQDGEIDLRLITWKQLRDTTVRPSDDGRYIGPARLVTTSKDLVDDSRLCTETLDMMPGQPGRHTVEWVERPVLSAEYRQVAAQRHNLLLDGVVRRLESHLHSVSPPELAERGK